MGAAVAVLAFGAAPAAALPDGRAHELVSGVLEDNLGDVFYGVSVTDDGNGIRFGTMAARPDAGSAQLTVANVARRTAAGWAVGDLNPPLLEQQAYGISSMTVVDASSDLSVTVFRTYARLHPDDVDTFNEDFYRYDSNTGQLDFISSGTDNEYGGDGAHHYVGANEDLSRIFFRMDGVRLVPDAPAKGIYEWSDGTVRLISRLPDGTPSDSWVDAGAYAPNRSGLDGEKYGGPMPHGGAHAVSDDGTRLYWSNTPGGVLYLHEDGSPARVISKSQRTGSVGDTVTGAAFVAADHDGSRVYFVHRDQLTDAASPGGGIYRYDLDYDELELVTPPTPGGAPFNPADAVVSDDFSHLYFASTQVLAPGAVEGGDSFFGNRNVYLWDGSATRFVGNFGSGARTMRASRDGRFLLIESTASVGGAQLDGHQGIYRYDAQADELVCASCRADGSPSQGDALINSDQFTSVPTASFFVNARGLSDDGRVFFTSSDRLVPADVTFAKDAYQFGPAGPSLLSSGQSGGDSYVQDNSDDGRAVFFTTPATLVHEDTDGGLTDLYDARVGGGFPKSPTAARPCRDDECQGALSATPDAATPVTLVGERARTLRARAVIVRPRRAARIRFARSGVVRLAVRASRPGTLRIAMRGKVARRYRLLDKAHRVVRRKGVVRVTLKLPRSARMALRKRGRLPVSVSARLDGGPRSARVKFSLHRNGR